MGDGRPGTGGTAGTVASGARGTGRGGVSTRRGACAVPGGGKDEKLFAKDMRFDALCCRLLGQAAVYCLLHNKQSEAFGSRQLVESVNNSSSSPRKCDQCSAT